MTPKQSRVDSKGNISVCYTRRVYDYKALATDQVSKLNKIINRIASLADDAHVVGYQVITQSR